MNIHIPSSGLCISTQRVQTQNYGTARGVKGSLSELNTGDTAFAIHTLMDGNRIAEYHVNLIDILDKVILTNCLNFVTLDQQRFLERFFFQAGEVDKKLNENRDNPYQNMDSIMQQLDSFLGNYYGVDDGRYAR